MPLIKSKSDKAFQKNVAAEVKAGKPVKQAVAIAYSTKRAAKKASGGSMDPRHYDSDVDYYEAVKTSGANPKARKWAKESMGAPLDAAYYKKQAEAKKAKDAAFYAKHAAANSEYDKKMKEFVNQNRAKSGLPPLKSGGKVSKRNGW